MRGGLILLAFLIGASCVWSESNPTGDDERTRRLLDRLRADPVRFEQLRRAHAQFRALPAEQQAKLRTLDEQLHAEPPATRARLHKALAAYADWLDTLPVEDRRRVTQANTARERLQAIQALREQQWIERLPKAYREQLAAQPDQRPQLLAKWRTEERQWQEAWRQVRLQWPEVQLNLNLPVPLADPAFRQQVQQYMDSVIRPQLAPAELQRLNEADEALAAGRLYVYARTVAELAERHAPVLLGPIGPSKPTDIVDAAQRDLVHQVLRHENKPAALKKLEGRWPDWAISISDAARRHKVQLAPFGPVRLEQLSAEQKEFFGKLFPQLKADELEAVRKAEGTWPDYPKLLMQLVKGRNLSVPGVHPPGDLDRWRLVRVK